MNTTPFRYKSKNRSIRLALPFIFYTAEGFTPNRNSGYILRQWTDRELHAHRPEYRPQTLQLWITFRRKHALQHIRIQDA